MERAEGAVVYDTEGNAYIDAFASLWTVNVGHGRKEIFDAIEAQAEKLAVYHIFQIGNEPTIKLAAKVASTHARRPEPRVPHAGRRRVGRDRRQDGAPVLAQPGQRHQVHGALPRPLLPRHHDDLDERSGALGQPQQVRALAARLHQAGRALLLPLRLEQDLRRRLRDGVRQGGRAGDRLLRRRERRHHARRDDDRHGRRDPAAGRVLAHGLRDLQGQRCARDQRRGHHRLRPQRHLVRLRAVRLGPRPHHPRQGAVVGLPAARRGRRQGRTCTTPSWAAPARPS